MTPGRKRGTVKMPPRANGPRFSYSAVPPPPERMWPRPFFARGFRGRPNPNFMEGPIGPRPMMVGERVPGPYDFRPNQRPINPLMMEQEYAPRDDRGFGPDFFPMVDEMDEIDERELSGRPMTIEPPDFSVHGQSMDDMYFSLSEYELGPPMSREFEMDSNRGMPLVERGPMPNRGFGPVDEMGPMDHNNYLPSMDNRGFGMMESHMDRAFGPSFIPDRDEVNPGFGRGRGRGRGFNGLPYQDLICPRSRPPMKMQEWAGTTGSPPPRSQCLDQITPEVTGQEVPKQPQSEGVKPPAPKKPKSTVKTFSAKPPLGRSMGVISFIGNNYGFIEREDLKKFSFSFDAFVGNHNHLIPGVKVHFTALKKMGKECATDVIVTQGGTEEVDNLVFSGVVSKVLPGDGEKFLKELRPGRIHATPHGPPLELPFAACDTKATLLLNDHVHFHLVTDLVTKYKRATDIKPHIPETFQFTQETREMGVIMNNKDGLSTIMTENRNNLCSEASENLTDGEVNVMDEVEFTVITVKGTEKAIRLRKLPEGSVVFDSQSKSRLAEVKENSNGDTPDVNEKGKWKPVTSEVLPQRTVVFEDVSSEQYEGSVLKTIPKTTDKKQGEEQEPLQEPLQGLLETTVEGVEKMLSFGAGDVVTEATMMVGDKVQFNISTNRGTQEERAINVEILPETFQESTEQRKIGVVLGLADNFGFIKSQQDPRLFFDLSEVMEEKKLTASEKVEFTIITNETAGEGYQAIRIKRLIETVFTSAPKLEGLGATNKEKKKMTIKLMRDEIKNLKVNIENKDLPDAAKSQEEKALSDALKECRSQPVKSEVKDESSGRSGSDPAKQSKSKEGSGRGERSRSRENSRRRSRSRSRDQSSSRCRRHRSSSKDRREGHSRQRRSRSRSRSRDRGRRRGRSHSRSPTRSRSRERSSRRRRSRSSERKEERREDRRRRRSGSKEHSTKRLSKSPVQQGGTQKKSTAASSKTSASSERGSREPEQSSTTAQVTQEQSCPQGGVDKELIRKKRELEELNELIARKRAIVAMEQKTKIIQVEPEVERVYEWSTHSDDQYETDRQPREDVQLHDTKPKPFLMKSILKKRSEPVAEPDFQLQTDTTKALPKTVDYGKPISMPSHTADPSPINKPASYQQSVQTSNPRAFYQQTPPLSQCISKPPSADQVSPLPHSHLGQSSLHQTPFNSPPSHHSPPSQYPAPVEKSNLSTQMQRFLNILNKGIDSNLMSSLVQEARKETTSIGDQQITTRQSGDEEFHRDDKYDPYDQEEPSKHRIVGRVKSPVDLEVNSEDYSQDYLLPHERAVQDGSGFSRILGIKHGLHAQEEAFREANVDDEEQYLYGEPEAVDDRHRYADDRDRYESSAVADRYRINREPSPTRQQAEETRENREDKVPHYEKIQSLLRTIGLNLDTAEVSKLADRTRERLYGKKVKPLNISSESLAGRPEQPVSQYDRQRIRTDSTESEGLHCVSSPAESSHREVYMSYPDAVRYRDSKGEVVKDLRSLIRTIRNTPEPTRHAPDPMFPTTHSTVSQYSQESPQSSYPTTQYPYYNDGHYQRPGLDQDANSQHPGTPYAVVPMATNAPNLAVGQQGMPIYLQPGHNPYASQMGHSSILPPRSVVGPSPSFFVQPPLGPQAISGYPLHALTGHPLINPVTPGGPAFAIQQPQPVKQIETIKQVPLSTTTKSRCLRVIETVKTEATTSTPASETTLSLDTAGETETKQAATRTEDDIRAKQKKRLEQFNLRMKQKKKERQIEAQRTHAKMKIKDSIPGKVICKEVKNVWICGHSLVFWAEKRAKSPEFGMQLGMDPNSVRVWWKGTQGMTWSQLLPHLLQLKSNWPNPDVILMHLGGNDIGRGTVEALLAAVKKDLASLRSVFSQCLLVWSDILPRRSWRHTDDSQAVENIRAAVNRRVHGIMAELGGTALTHNNIMPGSDAGLYRPDGVHLSGKGIDTFNLNMQDFLERWETETNQTAEESVKEEKC